MSRMTARALILGQANLHSRNNMSMFRMRHLHRAVFICRQRGYVSDKILTEAGFNPRKRINGKARRR